MHVLFASDDSPEAVADAKEYIAIFSLTRDDVSIIRKAGQTLVIAKRDCRDKLRSEKDEI
jgi:hypothetical protein